jgi:hypothetical protein
MDRVHFVEGDTDSMYWAVAGDPNEDNSQGFKTVIKDHTLYNRHVYEFFPRDFYSSNSSNPKFETKFEKIAFTKKVLGLAIKKK